MSPSSTTAEIGAQVELTVSVGPPLDLNDILITAHIDRPIGSPVVDAIGEADVTSAAEIYGFRAGPPAVYRVARVGRAPESVHTLRLRCVAEGMATVRFECLRCSPSPVEATVRCTGAALDGGMDAGDPPGPDAGVDGGAGAGRTPILAYTAGLPGLSGARHLFVRTAEGETYQLDTSLDPSARIAEIVPSPDGRQILFRVGGFADPGVYIVPSDGSEDPTMLSRPDDYVEKLLTPTSDFSRIGYERDAPEPAYADFTVLRPDGTEYADLTSGTENVQSFIGFSPDGAWAAFDAHDASGERHLWTVRTDGTELGSMADNALNPYEARWSPTSNHIFYRGYDAADMLQLFVGPGDRSSPPSQVTTNGPGLRAWIPNDAGFVHVQNDPVSGDERICRRAPPEWSCEVLFQSSTANVSWTRPAPSGEVIVFRAQEGSDYRLYEVPTDGSAAAHVVSNVSVQPYDLVFSGNPTMPGYAFTSSEGTFFQPVGAPFMARMPMRIGDPANSIVLSEYSPDIALIADRDGNGADELYLQRGLTGGGTELPPMTLVSREEDFVREAIFVRDGIVYKHDTRTEGSLIELLLFVFGTPTSELIARHDRVDEIVALSFFHF